VVLQTAWWEICCLRYCHLPAHRDKPINGREMTGSVKKKEKKGVRGMFLLNEIL